jgi:drug/metabolite transporter (DMT)-like permease
MNRTAQGIGLALVTALISGVAIYVNTFAVKELSDAAIFTTLKNGVAALVLFGICVVAIRRPAIASMDSRSWLGLVSVGVLGGGAAFLLFFTGLSMASAPSAAFIHKTLFVWVALLAVPLLGERLGWLQIAALGTLLASQLMITPPNGVVWGTGETFIAAATLLWAVEVIVAKRLLTSVDSFVLGVGRLGVGLVVLVGYLALSGRLPLVAELSPAQWTWVLVTGLLLAGYVGTWFAALSRANASVVTAVLVLGAPITAMLDAIAKGSVPASLPLVGYLLIVTAAVLVTITALRRARPRELLAAEA